MFIYKFGNSQQNLETLGKTSARLNTKKTLEIKVYHSVAVDIYVGLCFSLVFRFQKPIMN